LLAANRDPRMKELTLDYLRRWRNLGGTALAAVTLVATAQPATYGDNSLLETLNQTEPKYDAFIAFANGQTTTLPLTAADLPPPPPLANCTPSCVWGTCFNGTCECYSG
jgi:hypothetical protein